MTRRDGRSTGNGGGERENGKPGGNNPSKGELAPSRGRNDASTHVEPMCWPTRTTCVAFRNS